MTSECDSAAEIDVILSLLQVTRENGAICYRKGRFTELIVHFLEMRCNIKSGKGALQSHWGTNSGPW